ncbi:MAG: hypothetical protein CVT80_03060 [Alphaproteobacteria bacterium HGW-Alphaproteobacteria-2]|nr:MAG: hypothetical protein CVT80_03060 [Alphaproteobacteria bacterium HGW-Alphaproteobacteria-2]
MRAFDRIFRTGTVIFFIGATAVGAQSLNSIRGPAEEPPPSYQGRQYVDSAGCVFVRAGVGGNVTWVPRVDRQRRPICDQTQTLGGGARAVAEAPRTAPAPANPVAAATPVAARPSATSAAPAAAPPSTGVAILAASSGPPSTADAATLQAACDGKAPGSLYRVSIGSRQFTVRCGSQAPRPARVTPRSDHVAVARTYGSDSIPVPEGYASAHAPGRLNPYRAQGTPEGEAAMNRLWTRTVPRREIPGAAAATGAPGHVFASSKRLATSSAPQMHRVQVATFGNVENAAHARERFRALGLPVETRKLGRGGFLYEVIYLGPFLRKDELDGALEAARRAGFHDARAVR